MRVLIKMTTIRDHFFAGVLVVVPFAVISWIGWTALDALWGIHHFLPDAWQPENWIAHPALVSFLNFLLTLVCALVLVVGISILGWVSKQILGRKILEFVSEAIIQKIPLIRSIYGALDQLLRTMSSSGAQQFHRVVFVEYPRAGSWTLAFVTGVYAGSSLGSAGEVFLNLYVPTTPNPTSGFYLIVAESQVRESHMTVEEAFKMILSLGIAQPAAKEAGHVSR